MMFRQGVKWELMRRNPVDGTRRQPHRPEKAAVFSLEEVAKILEAGEGRRFIGLMDLGFTLGPRPEELFGFQWQDWDEKKEELAVVRKVAEVDGRIEIGQPKTAAGTRTLVLPSHITGSVAGPASDCDEGGASE